jgi:hypothetical protein
MYQWGIGKINQVSPKKKKNLSDFSSDKSNCSVASEELEQNVHQIISKPKSQMIYNKFK